MTARELNQRQGWRTCLGCGKRMWTDRCHRICKTCRRRHNAVPAGATRVVALVPGIEPGRLVSVDCAEA